MTGLQQLIENLTGFLEYQKEEGRLTLDISPETREALRTPTAPVGPAARPGLSATRPATPVPPRPAAAPPGFGDPAAAPVLQITGKTLEEIAKQISTCTACPLHASRTCVLPGEGNPNAPDILFIGDAPNEADDRSARPFSGEAGQLLDKMIAAMGYRRDELFLTHVAKCHPPGTRVPLAGEMAICLPCLQAQIKLIRPKIIVALGKTAMEGLFRKPVAITRLRGTWQTFEGIAVMPTYSPSYLLLSPERKGEAWADLKQVLAKLGKEPPAKKS